jgi:PAS domain S-box-containing protein
MAQKSSHKHVEQQTRQLEKPSGKGQQRPEKFGESDALFRSLFENGPEAMVVIDAETGKFVDANANALQLFKLAREELIGIGPLDISPTQQPDGHASKEAVQEKIQELLNENPEPFEWVHRDASGHDLLCEIRHSKLPITGRKLYCAIAIDITRRRQKENEIKQYKRIIESVQNPIGLVDRNFIYQYVNEPYCQAFKKSAHEIIGYSVPELFGRNFFKKAMESHYKQCFDGQNVNYQEWFDFPGWGRRHMDVRYYPLQKADCQVVAVVTNVNDITENKLAEQTLAEQLGFERLIANIAAQLAKTKPVQLEVAINSILQSLGQFLHTERAFLAQFSEDGSKLDFTNIWTTEGIHPSSEIFELDMASEIPWVIQQIRKGEVIKAGPGLTGLPDEAKKLRSQLERDGISSGLVVPVQVEGKSIGMLGLDTIVRSRDYAPAILSRLKILADIIGSMLKRVQTQEALQGSLNEVEQLKERLEQENIYLREEIEIQHRHGEIIGKSKPVVEMLSLAEQVAETGSTVLILGETGTGKELLAQSIHRLSPGNNRQMVKVNCAALPATLIESELFGREKGAYTGAMTRQIGRFEIADGSTIFLDEIGELPMEVQAKLLRVLQEGQFERLGNPRTISVAVRIIASTNRDLAKAVAESRFREDLYYRLNVFPITVPPLRDRTEDIPLLVWALVKEFEKAMGKAIEKIPQKSIDALQQYSWPGNIRELRNVVENAMILSKNKILKLMPPTDPDLNITKDLKLEVVERNHIVDVLKKTSWRVSGDRGAAKLLGLKPTTLESRMKKLGIVRPR